MTISPPSSPTPARSHRFATRSSSRFRRPLRNEERKMIMSTRKTILVFGATGAQGGGVARNLLEQGRNLFNAVAYAKIQHFIFSTLPPIEKETGGALRSPHFDLKAEHEELARSLGIPSTFVHVPFYYENFLYFFPPRPAGDGTYAFGFPQGETPLAAISVEDVGAIVAPMFEEPEKYIGKVVKLAGDEIPAAAYAQAMSRAAGADIRYTYIPRETFAAFGFPGAEDLADMFEYYRLHIPSRAQDIETCRALAPNLQSFDAWIARNGAKLRATLKA